MLIVGLDEVGRGCWAGPLVAAAVCLGFSIDGLADSKKLSQKKRQALDTEIRSKAESFGVGWVMPSEIDEIGLTKAVQLAMLRAMKQIDCQYEQIVIDGNINFFRNVTGLRTSNILVLPRADDTVPAVSAASIIAKVARDKYMVELAGDYPGYGFEKNVGYGTAVHIAALKELGVSDQHRKSYRPIRELLP